MRLFLFGVCRVLFMKDFIQWKQYVIVHRKKKQKHDLKQRMAKFKRAKKKLMNKVRVGGMFGGGGGILGGLMESMGDTSKGKKKKNKKTSTTAEQSMLGSSNNMLLGALMSNDNVDNVSLTNIRTTTSDASASNENDSSKTEEENNLDFAWPGKEQGEKEEHDDTSSDSAISSAPSSDSEPEKDAEPLVAVESNVVTTMSKDVQQFSNYFNTLSHTSEKAKEARKTAWPDHGNGLMSLAETDAWILTSLTSEHGAEDGERLYNLFKPCYIRAFNDAKDVGKETRVSTKSTTEDYVTRSEFRLLNAYIAVYSRMFDAFDQIDGNNQNGVDDDAKDDRKMTLEEWKIGYPKVQNHGFVVLNKIIDEKTGDTVESVFKEMDGNGKGTVLLNEFCKFIELGEKEKGTAVGVLLGIGEEDAEKDGGDEGGKGDEGKKEGEEKKEEEEKTEEEKKVADDKVDDGYDAAPTTKELELVAEKEKKVVNPHALSSDSSSDDDSDNSDSDSSDAQAF